jgi:hypothetical protein
MKPYNYHCIECNGLMLSTNKAAVVPTTCSSCEKSWLKKQMRVCTTKFVFQVQHQKAKIVRSKKKRKK